MAPVSSLSTKGNKRQKTTTASISSSLDVTLEKIRLLSSSLAAATASAADLNPLADLIQIAQSSAEENSKAGPTAAHKAVHIVGQVLQQLVESNRIPLDVDPGTSSKGPAKEASAADDPKVLVARWLKQRFDEFVGLLCILLNHWEKNIRVLALSQLVELQRSASKYASSFVSAGPSTSAAGAAARPRWAPTPWRQLMRALLGFTGPDVETNTALIEDDVREQFAAKWLNQHDDVRFFFLREIASTMQSPASRENSHVVTNTLALLSLLTAIPAQDDDLNTYLVPALGRRPGGMNNLSKDEVDGGDEGMGSYFDSSDEEREEEMANGSATSKQGKTSNPTGKRSRRRRGPSMHQALHHLHSHRAAFSSAWLSVLLPRGEAGTTRQKLSVKQMQDVLVRLHNQIMPNLVKPVLLHDFLVDCCDAGGATALLALNGLYTLMVKHNLDYPDFYRRLYALVDRDVMHVKYRARFFRLTELFLSSTHLPVALVASFIKRLSRLSISSPPAAIVMIIPFIYNLLKKHPTCMVLIHRTDEDGPETGKAFEDPYFPHEPNPLKTNAISSSLWEVVALQKHYLSSVATLARIFTDVFSKPNYAMEDFLDHSYATLFEAEVKRKFKPDFLPATAHSLPAGEFSAFPSKRRRSSADQNESDDEEAGALVNGGISTDVCSELWTF